MVCWAMSNALANFNSIKVRLKPYVGMCACLGVALFQFHKGTIKTN